MNDQQLDRNLRSIGKECFVTYFREFCDLALSKEDIAAQIAKESLGSTGKSLSYSPALTWRVYPARRIIEAGRATDALIIVSNSPRLPEHIKERANELARSLKEGLTDV